MKKKSAIGSRISRIMKTGVRKNTHKAVSKSNPRRSVPQKQAVAIAMNMARKGQLGGSAKKQAAHKALKKHGFQKNYG